MDTLELIIYWKEFAVMVLGVFYSNLSQMTYEWMGTQSVKLLLLWKNRNDTLNMAP